jgi:predicted RND superfamily exporter protein
MERVNIVSRYVRAARVIPSTVAQTMAMLSKHRLGLLVPVVGVLLLLALVLWLINAIAPLAPFVYSLF